MEKNYYKEYYHLERNHWWFKARGEMLIDHLRKVLELPANKPTTQHQSLINSERLKSLAIDAKQKSIKILNIGTATGRTSELLKQLGEVESVEYDKDCYEFVRDNLNIPITNASIIELPYADESYDVVVAFDVIEHVEDDQKAVSEMYRVCKKGGVVGVTVPAFMFLWSQHDVVNHHYRRYTSTQLESLFKEQTGLQKIYQSYFNSWLFFPIAAFRALSKILPMKKADNESETASDFAVMKGGTINSVFYHIFKSENFFLKRFIRIPVGVSLISTWKKSFF